MVSAAKVSKIMITCIFFVDYFRLELKNDDVWEPINKKPKVLQQILSQPSCHFIAKESYTAEDT